MAGCTVPGFDVDQLIGDGWGGELWLAHGRATGRAVVLRRLVIGDDIASHDRVRRAAARLVDVQHAHVVGLRGVLSVEGAVVLVHDRVAGIGLEHVLAERQTLTDAEVVTLAVPLAEALAAVHAHGLVHGRVSPSSVLVGDDGRPMLADTGVAALLDVVDRSGNPSDDVRDLALVCRAALGPVGENGPLAALLSAAAADDSARRPTATGLAAAVFATGPAAPIQPSTVSPTGSAIGATQPGPHAGARPRSHRRTSRGLVRGASRRSAALLVAAGAMTAAAFGGLAWAGADGRAPASTVGAPTSSYDVASVAARWRSVLLALDDRRAAAFAAASSRGLVDVYAQDSPALRRDRARLADLVAAGLRVERLHLRPTSVRVVTTSAQRVVLDVVDVLEPYDLRTARGIRVAARPGRGPASWRVTLVREAGGWRVYDVVRG